jgi:hypothetical protein
MQRIVMPVKFDGGLSISVLRNVQLFTKIGGSKGDQFSKSLNFQTFQTPPFEERTDRIPLEKVVSFFL